MKKLLLFACIVIIFPRMSFPQQVYWQQDVHYIIDVTLNDTGHTLDGFLKLQYTNHSPDTLSFIWFHVWPNAYKNDKTAFSEQQLQNGKTDFYFSDKDDRGYMNRLDFRTANSPLKTEDHPQYIDIVKVYLLKPLAPGDETEITTPFHVKLPYNFSRGGHVDQSYQITQWYPKPAVYDKFGWHPMPYLDQGEFYSEFGTYDVRITLPKNYIVAATGELQDEEEKKWMLERVGKQKAEDRIQNSEVKIRKTKVRSKKFGMLSPKPKGKIGQQLPTINNKLKTINETKTLRYIQNNIHDFAWFADKNFIINHDTIQLASGKIVDAYSFYAPAQLNVWKNSIQMIKDVVRFRSHLIGEYPYNVVSAVEAKMGIEGGMEYPTITCITPMTDQKSLDLILEHEVGHNWFYGILGSNERDHPWMDEGINTYYDKRYVAWKYSTPGNNEKSLDISIGSLYEGLDKVLINSVAKEKLDQPIATPSVDFTEINYGLIVYLKTGLWMQQLETRLGTDVMDRCMQVYYKEWQFKHPQPEDFKSVIEKNSGQDVSAQFTLLSLKGPITPQPAHKKIKPAFAFNLRNTDSITYINFLPAIGYNQYDGFMVGGIIHNFNLPRNRFEFIAVPLYGTRSKEFDAFAALHYTWYPDNTFQKIAVGLGAEKFSSLKGVDSSGLNIFGGFTKFAPFLRFTFSNMSPRSTKERWIEWKTFLIGEKGFDYVLKEADSTYYPTKGSVNNRYVNQLTYCITDYRALYPYDIQFQVQQGAGFYRATATANYFFNYAKEGGANVRFFAGKFGFIGSKTTEKEFGTFAYQPKLTAIRGNEDYTYSNYFVGRNEIEGTATQQIMVRDGGLKIRTDLFQGLQGRSEDWIASLNFNTTIPSSILPKVIPLKIFFDVGTYAEAWKDDAITSRFLYVGGLQLSLFKDLINIYAPIIYSSEFRNNLKTVPEENKFLKKISFSIDIQRFNLRRLSGNKIPL